MTPDPPDGPPRPPSDLRLEPDVLPPVGPGTAWPLPSRPPRPPKFQHNYRKHVILLLLTVLTTTLAGSCNYAGFQNSLVEDPTTIAFEWGQIIGLRALLAGFATYGLPALLILGCHELGHYALCRRYNVDATLPYFLPSPPLFLINFGTFGAVIKIKEAFPSKRALFDIGIAGPIAGFIVLLPFLYLGVAWSPVVSFPESSDTVIYFGEPLLMKFVSWLHHGTLPEGTDTLLHPLGFAAWFGMLATALNLLPFGQLDGGHIAYAVFGRHGARISMLTLAFVLALAWNSPSLVFLAAMLVVMAYYLGFRHPPVVDEHVPLDPGRKALAVFAVVMFILCFTPTPIFMDP